MRRALLVLAWCTTSACSFGFMTSPPPFQVAERQVAQTGNIRCTRWPILPGIDAAAAVATGLLTWLFSLDGVEPVLSRGADVAIGAGVSATLVASSVYGFIETSECRQLYRALDSERRAWKEQHRRR